MVEAAAIDVIVQKRVACWRGGYGGTRGGGCIRHAQVVDHIFLGALQLVVGGEGIRVHIPLVALLGHDDHEAVDGGVLAVVLVDGGGHGHGTAVVLICAGDFLNGVFLRRAVGQQHEQRRGGIFLRAGPAGLHETDHFLRIVVLP